MKFWKQKAKQRLKSHGKEFSAQEALLAKLVAAPGEYKRQDGFDLQVSKNQDDQNINLISLWKDLIRALARKNTLD